jgi:hypothetical protein
MNRRFFISLLIFVAAGLAAAPIKSPSEFLGFEVGADRKLADYRQIVSYFRMLDQASPRVELENLGKTTLGEDMIMAVISSEENLRNQAAIRETARNLADPRGLTDPQVDQLAREGKAIVLVTCNIHSTEIAASQFAMEWAHALATAEDEETTRRLNNVVLLLVPSLNPDGQTMVTEWYRKYLGTPYEGGSMPWLYHHYVGHDNNRDWFMLTQKETRNMTRAIYHRWFPQVFLDEHQMGGTGPRMFVPPFSDPLDPDVHPLLVREINLIGSNMAFRLEQAKKPGVIYGYAYDAYYPGTTRNAGWWRNITGLLTEVASAQIASPVVIESTELRGGRKGMLDYGKQVNHPNPWTGGLWRMRDIMDYERIASDALLEVASQYREDLLRNIASRARDVMTRGGQQAYWFLKGGASRKLADLMADHGVDVYLTPPGDFLIPLGQPYGVFVRELMEPQRFPEVRVGGNEPLQPYDVAAWTLPLMMGVSVRLITMPDDLSVVKIDPPILAEATQPAPKPELSVPAWAAKLRRPRVGIYKPWVASMDEGWTRFVLEQHGFNPTTLDNKAIRAGNLTARFDAIILPDIDREVIATGKPKLEEGQMRYRRDFPPDYQGGLEKEGAKALEDFVKAGGTLIAFDSATEYVIENFEVPVRNVLAGEKQDVFNSPGSLLRVGLNPNHPVTRDMPQEVAIFLDDRIAFETTPPGPEMQRWVLAVYPAQQQDILMSGWLHGVERLEKRAAAVALTSGKGKIVLFGFRPQHRAQTPVTFPLIFNALWWSVM